MDKNPDKNLVISKIKNYLNKNTLTAILCSEPFAKAAFLSKVIDETNLPVIYLDFDLLYSGYVKSEIISENKNVSLFAPSKDNWNKILGNVLLTISNQKHIIIIDSLNGLYNLFDGKDIGRLINTYIMLLVFSAKESGSSVLFSSMVRKKDKEGWVLSPTSRRIIDTKMTKMYLKKNNSEIIMEVIGDDQSVINSIKII